MTYSLIIPAYDEAAIIARTLSALRDEFDRSLGGDWEIIVVDNASTDGTAEVVRGFPDERVRVLAHAERGKGGAIRAGFMAARGDILAFTDADLSIPPNAIVSALKSVARSATREVLAASRFHPESAMPGREWWRIASSRMYNLLARSLFSVRITDIQCPLKAFPCEFLPYFIATRELTWFFDLEFIAILERCGVPVREFPIVWDEHRYPDRRSKFSTIGGGILALGAMVRIRSRLPSALSRLERVESTTTIGRI